MIVESFYLSDPSNHTRAEALTELSIFEIEEIVGRFSNRSHRAGDMKGEVVVMSSGKVLIRDHFSKRKIWELLPQGF